MRQFVKTFPLLALVVIISLAGTAMVEAATGLNPQVKLLWHYYKVTNTCDDAEAYIRHQVEKFYKSDNSIAPKLLRLLYSDCMVNGCDASVLLEGPNSERTAPQNRGLGGFVIIDKIKQVLESRCPGVVSCADILNLAARDAVHMAGAPSYPVFTGRRDGGALNADAVDLPSPSISIDESLAYFKSKGLDVLDMTTLLGAHSVGKTHCSHIVNRLYNFKSTGKPDPTINTTLVSQLRYLCPPRTQKGQTDPLVYLNPDSGLSNRFTSSCYSRVLSHNAVLGVDQELLYNEDSKEITQEFASGFEDFRKSFALAMSRMGSINVLTGKAGEIRRDCKEYRPVANIEDEGSFFHVAPRQILHSHRLNTSAGSGFLKCKGDHFTRKCLRKNRIQAIAEYLGSASDRKKPSYHPSEEIRAYVPENPGDSRLPPPETARTIIEVNRKGTLMLSGLLGIGLHENILWPDIPYVTDQHGNIYFQVKENEDIMQTVVTSDNNYVQVIVGFDTMEMIKDMELNSPSGIGFGIEEIEDGITEVEDENKGDEDERENKEDEEWVAVLADGSEDDDYISDSDESLGDWANLETMRTCHPMYFARRMAEVASNDPANWMKQPSAGLAIQGLLSRVIVKDPSDIQKHISDPKSTSPDENKEGENSEEKLEDICTPSGDESETLQVEDSRNAISYYKLEMIRIQLITAQGHQTEVEAEAVRKAQPDAIALASDGIVSGLEEDGDKLTEALKSLCWRHNGIQAEEVKLIGIDSLGFELRLCSGMQIETLRFAFLRKATSVHNAEGQLRELLFASTPLKPAETKTTDSKRILIM
ncbi:unnamed protein product [Arabis nemorensis]|uniref:peroxidase n=1 Tax=Arabis nemorensis TaxID=586526 RepID=A0A565CUJ5_9BRAS|nr:unnamed protein product [Arabis nemorensis]